MTSQAIISQPNRSPAHAHQRKHSSSKTPNPSKNDSRTITAPSEAPTKEASPAIKDSAEKRPNSRSSKRKSKDAMGESGERSNNGLALNLPSVPSTQHIHANDIHMSSFFSIHRPISVTTPIPPESSTATFSSIFDPKPTPKHKLVNVIYTLSSAVETLENVAAGPQGQGPLQMTAEETDLRAAVTQASSSNADPQPHNLDLPAKTLHINLQELAKNFRPYNPPPVPIPMNFSDGPAPNMSQQIKWQLQTQPSTQKTYTTKLTIFESTYPSGRKIYKSHATPIVEEPAAPSAIPEAEEKLVYLPPSPRNQPFLGRMRKRQLQYMDRMGEVWSMISVKRQRKLKMKKHKYKKLMKRTKNLRRRLDRI